MARSPEPGDAGFLPVSLPAGLVDFEMILLSAPFIRRIISPDYKRGMEILQS
jgi:hypothetical protein